MSSSSLPAPTSVVFKAFNNTDGSRTDIAADVYLPKDSAADTPLLPLIWIHTGGLLQGTRKFIPPHLVRGVNENNVALIAPDFRLCPQVTVSEVLDDIRDCVNFFLDSDKVAAALPTQHRLDSQRYVLGGSSAGGWISLLLGLSLVDQARTLRTRPTAVFSIYPITTVDRELAPFFYEAQKPVSWSLDGKAIDGQQLEERGCLVRCVDGEGRVSSNDRGVLIKTESPPTADPVRAQLYNYARQEANFASLVLARPDDAVRFSVPHLVRRQRLDEGPRVPVMMVYGDSDPKVPHSQSLHVIEALEAVGYNRGGGGDVGSAELVVEVKKGGDHLYDMDEKEEVPGLWRFIMRA